MNAVARAKYRAKMLERYHAQRNSKIIELGGKCIKCGSTEDLQFDHIDPKSKRLNLSKIWAYTYTFHMEAKKCQLLCRTCHLVKSAEERGHKVHGRSHGTLYGFSQMKCRCEPCKEASRSYRRELYARNREAKNAYKREWRKKRSLSP